MNKEELENLKKTFPWSYETYIGKMGGMIRIVDKNGQEVDLGLLVRFVCYISKLMQPKN